jgi:hypothetical protein
MRGADRCRALLAAHVAQEDPADHVARFVVDGERDLALALGDVLEPA